ncbi:hypothetical protein [Nocardioides aestuarii]|uniref:Uncharacterized protein n=1 Tax=Nocardioides aestuarii TaxID=252231 RepID=A0ABW4TPW2_9ACTN
MRTVVATALLVVCLGGRGNEQTASPSDPADPSASSPSATATASATASADPEPAWRAEYWHDVAVEVPGDWWFGSAPLRLPQAGDVDLYCGWGATYSPAGDRAGPREAMRVQPGYVGRPVPLDDTCENVAQSASVPVEPYLWFDSPFPIGVRRLAEGWVEQTWELEGTRMTVATTDDEVRRHVVGSAVGGATCLANRGDLLDPSSEVVPPEDEEDLVCAYRRERGEAWLTYATPLDRERAQRFVAAFDAAPDQDLPAGRACDLGGDDEWVVVQVAGTAYVVRPQLHGCPHVQGDGRTVGLTEALVEPWSTGGVPAVLLSRQP